MKLGLRALAALCVSSLVGGCALLTSLPSPSGVDDRLKALPARDLPLSAPVTIHWNEHQVPYIVAETDADAAFALGLVHAHLRLGQMAVYKRIAQGRIAEMGGPLATDIDESLRILGFGRGTPDVLAAMPPDSRAWLDRFIAGINHYQATVKRLPVEYEILGLEREPWTAEDVLTFGRLAGTDVNWLVWFSVLELRGRQDWPQIWERLTNDGGDSTPSFPPGDVRGLAELLAGSSRSGSNTLAIAPSRSTTGGAILANDPHLGINLPNLWLLAGIKTPTLQAVGLMVPGLPFFAIGRNERIAWGGTNMRAASSDLVDASSLEPGQMRERSETIGVRWWLDREITIRETPWGPLLSDAPQLADKVSGAPPFALRWLGHDASDEITAMLEVARAGDFDAFRRAFTTFAVSGQNMLYADVDGNIGQVMAVQVPQRDGPPDELILSPSTTEANFATLLNATELPASYNPPEGVLASANNRPTRKGPVVGWFYSPDDRVERMAAVVGAKGRVGLDDVKALQRDVYMQSAVKLRDLLVNRMDGLGVATAASGSERDLLAAMRAWDGFYTVESTDAVAFERFRAVFTTSFYKGLYGTEDWQSFANLGRAKALLIEDIRATDDATLTQQLGSALAEAADGYDPRVQWGDLHRLELRHPLAFLPVIGGRFQFGDYPIGGSSDTLMKTAHSTTMDEHRVRYGSQARHVSDMTDPDGNWFVLLGGQDGWINSSTFLDQVPLWLEGRYIRMPLKLETVRADFGRTTVLNADQPVAGRQDP